MARSGSGARSVFAVVDGFLLFLALQGIFYAVAFLGLHMSFDTPTHAYLTSNLVWSVASALAAGYVTARVARRSPLAHAIALAVPFLLLSLYNLNKGLGGRHTPFVVAINTLVPLAFLWGSTFVGRRATNATLRDA